MKRISTCAWVAAALFSITAPSRADWAADMTLKSSSKDAKGKMFWREGGMRMDMSGSMSMIVDHKAKKAWNAIHSQKMYIEVSMDKVGVDVPNCSGSDIDACIAKEGFKKSGSETVNGHDCTVYEKKHKARDGKTTHVKVWRPHDLKEVPFVRSTTSDERGVSGQIDLTNIKIGKQDPALFAPPAGYKAMAMPAQFFGKPKSGAPGSAGSKQGMSADEMAKMRDEMMKKFGKGGHP